MILGLGLALFFHLFVALFLNVLTNRYRLTGKNSYLVAFAYLLLSVGTMDSYFFTTQCVINVLVVFMMFRLFQLPSTSRPKAVIFDVSMLIGVMTIINPANIFLLVIVWVGIVSFRSLYIGDWIVSIIGVFLPALYLVVALYLFDLLYLIESWRFHVGRINFPEPKYITLLGTALLFIPSLFVFLGNYGQKAAVIRKMSNLILLLFIGLLVNSTIFGANTSILLSLLIPISIIVGIFLEQVKKMIIAESLIFLFIIVAGYYHYINWF
ncbi:MAG: hypothetical protein JKY42_06765 [Flavobacteriales bacterium]|nr:hypothetical protein [Flavobacteriales bacterium]